MSQANIRIQQLSGMGIRQAVFFLLNLEIELCRQPGGAILGTPAAVPPAAPAPAPKVPTIWSSEPEFTVTRRPLGSTEPAVLTPERPSGPAPLSPGSLALLPLSPYYPYKTGCRRYV